MSLEWAYEKYKTWILKLKEPIQFSFINALFFHSFFSWHFIYTLFTHHFYSTDRYAPFLEKTAKQGGK